MLDHVFDQGAFGAKARKPTQLLEGPSDILDNADSITKTCTHTHFRPVVGQSADGSFRTAALAAYPAQLCQCLANRAWGACARAVGPAGDKVWEAFASSAEFPAGHPARTYAEPLLRGSLQS